MKSVQAEGCGRASNKDVVIFGHGGGLYSGDYQYLCDLAPPGVAVARLISPDSDDPMDLELMAMDLAFLARALPQQSRENASSAISGCLNGRVILAGHSMGAAAAILAGAKSTEGGVDNVYAIASLAPGFWGDAQASLLKENSCTMGKKTFLLAVGDQDCANSLAMQALPVWGNVTTGCARQPEDGDRFLVDLKGATHCQWANPTVGACPFDRPCPATRLDRSQQQHVGLQLLFSLVTGNLANLLGSETGLSYVTQDSPQSAVAALHTECPHCPGDALQYVV